jgi:hypothetical protein
MKNIILAYLLMAIIISIGGYIFGLTISQSIKIGLFAGLYVFVEKLVAFRKRGKK